MMPSFKMLQKTPLRRQIDPLECGAVCLGIILEYFGRYVDSKTLREACGVSRNGADAEALVKIAPNFGLTVSARKLLLSEVKTIKTPAILFVDQCHFVVFEGVRFHRYYINDPARGRYALDEANFRKRFSHIVLEYAKGENFVADGRDMCNAKSRGHHQDALLVLLLGCMAGIFFVMLAGGAGAFQSLPPNLRNDYVFFFVLIFGGILMGLSIIVLAWQRVILRCARMHTYKESADLVTHLADLSPSFFEERPFAVLREILTTSVTRNFARARAARMPLFWSSFLLIIFGYLLLISVIVALAVAFCIVFYLLLMLWQRWHPVGQILSVSQTHAHESFLEAKTLVAMGQTELIIDNIIRSQVSIQELNKNSRRQMLAITILAVVLLLAFSAMTVPLWRSGDLSLLRSSELLFLCLGIIYGAYYLAAAPDTVDDASISLLHEMNSSRLTPHVSYDKNAAVVALHDVSFTYPGEKNAVLSHVSLSIPQGEIIGVVGASLSGVSTLLKIIAGYYQPISGEVIFLAHQDERLRCVLINNETNVMSGTLKDVVTLGDKRFTDEAIVHALRLAEATGVFYNRPMGLLAHLRENASNLCLSEKYRLLLAQALLHKPDVLVLDDVFFAIEPRMAEEVLTRIHALGIATIFNSYDGMLLSKSDRVVFLHNGIIHKIDCHEHLYFSDENYRSLVKPTIVEDTFV